MSLAVEALAISNRLRAQIAGGVKLTTKFAVVIEFHFDRVAADKSSRERIKALVDAEIVSPGETEMPCSTPESVVLPWNSPKIFSVTLPSSAGAS